MKASKNKHSYWMVKQELETYSWDDFVRDGSTDWSGVRNYQARNNLRSMKPGDKVLFYHSGKGKEVVGLAEVVKGAYPDPTADDPQWVAVDLKPVKPLMLEGCEREDHGANFGLREIHRRIPLLRSSSRNSIWWRSSSSTDSISQR